MNDLNISAYKECKKVIFQIVFIEVIIALSGAWSVYMLFNSIDSGSSISKTKFILISLCINATAMAVIGIFQNIFKADFSVPICSSIFVYIVSQIFILAKGYRPSGISAMIIAVILTLVAELFMFLLFILLYVDSASIYDIINTISYIQILHENFTNKISEYNVNVNNYNVITTDIINLNERLNKKRSRLKIIDNYYDHYTIPEIKIYEISLWHPFILRSASERFNESVAKYRKKTDKKINEFNTQIEYINCQLEKNNELYVEIKRVMERADNENFPDSLRSKFANIAGEHIGALNKKNRKIKKVW